MSFWVKLECWYRVYGFLVLKLYTVVLEYCWYGYTALYDVFLYFNKKNGDQFNILYSMK